MPSITCEKCFHQQSQETTDEAVLASLMVLNAYFLAIPNDLESQYWTVRSGEVGFVVCVLGVCTLLSFVGISFWIMCLVLPWVLGCWLLWRCIRRILEDFIVSLTDNEGFTEGEENNENVKADLAGDGTPSKQI